MGHKRNEAKIPDNMPDRPRYLSSRAYYGVYKDEIPNNFINCLFIKSLVINWKPEVMGVPIIATDKPLK